MGCKVMPTVLAAMLCLLLSGCFSWSAEESYKLPKPPQDYKNLVSAVNQTKRELELQHSTSVEDVPPSAGDNTSAVQMLDMDGDGSQETAVTFFRVVGAEMPLRICFYTLQEDGSYALTASIRGEGDGVYAVHYADMDGQKDEVTGKTCKEIVVSWQMGGNAYYLGVYALDGGQSQTLATVTYDSYKIVDLDRDSLMELAVCHIDQEQKLGEVELYNWNTAGLLNVEKAPLSANMTSIWQIRTNYLTDFVPALYIAGDLTDGTRVMDVVTIREGELVNLTLDPDTRDSREGTGQRRDISFSDVNSDSILELPRLWQLPSRGGLSGVWLADWVQYDNRGRAQEVCTTYHNVADGWYLVIPDSWRSRLVIYRNDSVSGQRAVIFALWQGEGKEPLPFLSIYKLTGASRNLRATSANRFILAEDSSTVYAATFYNTWDCGLDQSGLLENFRLIVSSWSND